MSLKLVWYGHATLGLETAGFRILVDPFFTGNPAASTTADKVMADYILISHGHGDHVGDAEAISRRTGAVVICNAEIADWFGKKGIKAHAQHLGGGYKHPFGYLKFTFAIHGSGLPDGSNGGNPAGFLLTTQEGEKVYLAQDTGLFGDMKLIGDEGLDLAVLPIGDNYTMGPDDALRAVELLRPKRVVPIHYNTFDLIVQDPIDWAQRVQAQTGVQVTLLKPGQSLTL